MKNSLLCLMAIAALLAAAGDSAQSSMTYAHPPMLLQVPFLPQVLPGDWPNTKNCGQAVSMMLKGYYGNYSPASSTITSANRWLATRLNNSRYLDANGWYTNFQGTNALGILVNEYCGLRCSPATGRDVASILDELNKVRPVIVGVMIRSGRLTDTNGTAHWALAGGWNARDQKILLNDPGANAGRFIPYPVAEFQKSWATQGQVYAPVWR